MKHLILSIAASVLGFGVATCANASSIYGQFTGTIVDNSLILDQRIPDGTPVSGQFTFSNSIFTSSGYWEAFSFSMTIGDILIQSAGESLYPGLGIETTTGDATFTEAFTATLIVVNQTVYTEG